MRVQNCATAHIALHIFAADLRGMTKRSATASAPTDPVEHQRWLDGIVRLAEAAQLRGVHPDTLRRAAARGDLKILKLGERAVGVRRRHALMLD
jgi:hypothetical protein